MKVSKVAALDVRIGDLIKSKDGDWLYVHEIDGFNWWWMGVEYSGDLVEGGGIGRRFVSTELVELNEDGEELLDVVKREDVA